MVSGNSRISLFVVKHVNQMYQRVLFLALGGKVLVTVSILMTGLLLLSCVSGGVSGNLEDQTNFIKLMSEDKLQQRNAILYYIQQGVEGEKFLLAQHDSIPYDRKYKLYYALGFIGGQESVCFLGRNTKARELDQQSAIYLVEGLTRMLSGNDMGAVYRTYNSEIVEYREKEVHISTECLDDLDHLLDSLNTDKYMNHNDFKDMYMMLRKQIQDRRKDISTPVPRR